MTNMKCYCKVVYACNLDVPQKALSETNHFYVIGGNVKKRSCKSIQRGWLKMVLSDPAQSHILPEDQTRNLSVKCRQSSTKILP